jgi:signal transduction histidine kinase
VTSLIVAVPATLLLSPALERIRQRDLQIALERVVRSQVNAATRERCESDPTWFLTGPLDGRPRFGVFVPTVPDQLEPRPRVEPQAFELFGYDEAFIGSGSATPRFAQELRLPMRLGNESAVAPYVTEAGTGVQMVLDTQWIASKCRYLLGRLEAPPNQARDRWIARAAIFGVTAAMAMLAAAPTIFRIRRQARHARESLENGFTSIAPERLEDELSSFTFVYNDAMTEMAQRKARIEDLDAALRRLVQSTDAEVAQPLAELEAALGSAVGADAAARDAAVGGALEQAHHLRGQIDNLLATVRLRQIGRTPARTPVDLRSVVADVVGRHQAFAGARTVTLRLEADHPVTVMADASLPSCAVANLVDNAVRYNVPGGEVSVSLAPDEAGRRFRLCVADRGPGVSEEHFRGLTAVHRFRGDETRNPRPNAPGLGLALAREIADRFDMQLDLKRPGAGGIEVELSGEVG